MILSQNKMIYLLIAIAWKATEFYLRKINKWSLLKSFEIVTEYDIVIGILWASIFFLEIRLLWRYSLDLWAYHFNRAEASSLKLCRVSVFKIDN